MKASHIKLQYPEDPRLAEIVLTVDRTQQNIQKIADLKKIVEEGKFLKADIKQFRNKRSLDANAYCFVLCQKIAEVIGNTKEYVYKQAIKQVGQFEIVPIKDEAVEHWIHAWESRGLGWQSERWRDSTLEGYTTTINYYGSSVYDSREMYILLQEIVTQAQELGIETMTERERQILIDKWGKEK